MLFPGYKKQKIMLFAFYATMSEMCLSLSVVLSRLSNVSIDSCVCAYYWPSAIQCNTSQSPNVFITNITLASVIDFFCTVN